MEVIRQLLAGTLHPEAKLGAWSALNLDWSLIQECREPVDLMISLGDGEHWSEDKILENLKEMTQYTDRILWASALPYRGGTLGRPAEWWAEKFREVGFEPVDFIRPRIWTDDTLGMGIREGILLYCRQGTTSWLEERKATHSDWLTVWGPQIPKHHELEGITAVLTKQRVVKNLESLVDEIICIEPSRIPSLVSESGIPVLNRRGVPTVAFAYARRNKILYVPDDWTELSLELITEIEEYRQQIIPVGWSWKKKVLLAKTFSCRNILEQGLVVSGPIIEVE